MGAVEITGVCDLSPALARFTAERFGAARWFTDYREMLDECDADIVHVLTPPATHERPGGGEAVVGGLTGDVAQREVPRDTAVLDLTPQCRALGRLDERGAEHQRGGVGALGAIAVMLPAGHGPDPGQVMGLRGAPSRARHACSRSM
jgi:hypothetical protein